MANKRAAAAAAAGQTNSLGSREPSANRREGEGTPGSQVSCAQEGPRSAQKRGRDEGSGKEGLGRARSRFCCRALGPKGNVSAWKRWRKEWRMEKRVRNERGKGTSGGGWRRVRGERRTITVRKGESDGETRREDTGDFREEESRRGMRTGVTGWAPLPAPRPASLPP